MNNLTHSVGTCIWDRTPKAFVRAVLVTACFAMPVVSHGQERSVRDQPRSLEAFDGVSGYEMFSPDRVGTLANPLPNELGFSLVLRMFHNVCLGLESGKTLDAVMPEGFAAYHSSPYYFGPDVAQRGNTTVLSSTGDIERDEDGGHPAIWLDPDGDGMTCKVEWRIAEEMSMESQQAIAGLLVHWLPWELALVPANRPSVMGQLALSDAIEWDRPCQGRWCPATAFYSLSSGEVNMRMTLNITDIEGESP